MDILEIVGIVASILALIFNAMAVVAPHLQNFVKNSLTIDKSTSDDGFNDSDTERAQASLEPSADTTPHKSDDQASEKSVLGTETEGASSKSSRDNSANESDNQTSEACAMVVPKRKNKMSKEKREYLHSFKKKMTFAFYKMHHQVGKVQRVGPLVSDVYIFHFTDKVQKDTRFQKKFFCYQADQLKSWIAKTVHSKSGFVLTKQMTDLNIARVVHVYSWPVPFPMMNYKEVADYKDILRQKDAELNHVWTLLGKYHSQNEKFIKVRLLSLFAFVAIGEREFGRAFKYLEQGSDLAMALEPCEWTGWLYLAHAFLYICWGGQKLQDELYDNALEYLEIARAHFQADTEKGASFNIATALILWWMFLIKSRAIRCSWKDETCYQVCCKHRKFVGCDADDVTNARSLLSSFQHQVDQIKHFPNKELFQAIIDVFEDYSTSGLLRVVETKVNQPKRLKMKREESILSSEEECTEKTVPVKQHTRKRLKSGKAEKCVSMSTEAPKHKDRDGKSPSTDKENTKPVDDIHSLFRKMIADINGKIPAAVQTMYIFSKNSLQRIIINIDKGSKDEVTQFLQKESPHLFKQFNKVLLVEQISKPSEACTGGDTNGANPTDEVESASNTQHVGESNDGTSPDDSETDGNSNETDESDGDNQDEMGDGDECNEVQNVADNMDGNTGACGGAYDAESTSIKERDDFVLSLGMDILVHTAENSSDPHLGLVGGLLYDRKSVRDNWPGVIYASAAGHTFPTNSFSSNPEMYKVSIECMNKRQPSKKRYLEISNHAAKSYHGLGKGGVNVDHAIIELDKRNVRRSSNEIFIRNRLDKLVKLVPFSDSPMNMMHKKVQKAGRNLGGAIGEIMEVDSFCRVINGSALFGYFAVKSVSRETFARKGHSGAWVVGVINDQDEESVYGIFTCQQEDYEPVVDIDEHGQSIIKQQKIDLALCLHFPQQIEALNQQYDMDLVIYNWDSDKEISSLRFSEESGYSTIRKPDGDTEEKDGIDKRIQVYQKLFPGSPTQDSDSDTADELICEKVEDPPPTPVTDSGMEGLSEDESGDDTDVE